jgi:glycosyltransferase involved in cell wall biosynthesis
VSSPEQPRIHLWVPDLCSGVGGIQSFSNFLLRALTQCCPAGRILVCAKNDSAPPPASGLTPNFDVRVSELWPGWQRTPAFTTRLIREALRDRPHLILSTHPNFAPVAALLKRGLGTRFAVVAHGLDVWGIPGRKLARHLRAAHHVLAVSRFTRSRLVEDAGIPLEKVSLLPNTFDHENFTPQRKPRYLLQRHHLGPDQPVVLTVCRLASAERYKGYDQLLQVLPRIRERIPDIRYVIVGKGPDRARLQKLIHERGLVDAITLAGFVPDFELPDYYRLCDVFAMPSKGEGFGIVFLEALASGKPVIAGNQDGSTDAVLDGSLGALVNPDNLDEIERAVLSSLSRAARTSHDDASRLRQRVVDAFGFDRFVATVSWYLQKLGIHTVVPPAAPVTEC